MKVTIIGYVKNESKAGKEYAIVSMTTPYSEKIKDKSVGLHCVEAFATSSVIDSLDKSIIGKEYEAGIFFNDKGNSLYTLSE